MGEVRSPTCTKKSYSSSISYLSWSFDLLLDSGSDFDCNVGPDHRLLLSSSAKGVGDPVTILSSLSENNIFVAVGFPTPRAFSPFLLLPKVCSCAEFFASWSWAVFVDVRKDLKAGPSMPLMRVKAMGKLVVMTATKLSRTAQVPETGAPLIGSIVMSTQRMVANTMMIAPALKSSPRPTFFHVLIEVCHNIGSGIEIRYRSVKTLKV